jgi:hypothetical protein
MRNKEVQFRYFEILGENEVREKIAAGHWRETQLRLAQEWVRQTDQARAEEEARVLAEQASIARSAKDAAWVAAHAANAARRMATISLVIAVLSALAAIVAMFISILGRQVLYYLS